MKTPAFHPVVALLLFGSMVSLSAQNLGTTRTSDIRPLAIDDLEGRDLKQFDQTPLPGSYDLTAATAQSRLSESSQLYLSQDSATLANRSGTPIQKVYVSADNSTSDATATDLPAKLALISAGYRAPGDNSEKIDCPSIGLSIQQRVKLDPAKVLEVVEAEISVNPSCACEIVKAALAAAGADVGLAADVVEVAATTAPETMRIASQCAIAAVPESLSTVQALLAKLDPNSGESGYDSKSSKSSKSAKSAKEPPPAPRVDPGNPLDLPDYGPPLPPPPKYPPPVTDTDYCPPSYEKED